MSQVTISGAVSGLDTATIINQLVTVQSNQQTILRTQQSAVQRRADAYAALTTSLTALGALATDLATTSSWVGATATSSSTSVTAAATGTTAGSITFDVTSVAAAHALVSTSTVSSTAQIVADPEIAINLPDGSSATLWVGSGSLAEVVAAINASDTGLRAAAVRTAPGEYRLQVTSSTTGADSEFTIDGITGIAMGVLTQGADATLHVGTNPATAYDITSSSNTFADLVPGMSFTVSRLENAVTVSTTVDGSTIADKVSTLVDAANGILADIAAKTAYDPTTRAGGAFTGQSVVRSLQQNILSAVSGTGAPGVRLTQSGRLTFDRTAFLTAFQADPDAVAGAFGATTTFTPADGIGSTSVSLSSATRTARAGTYDVTVTSMPDREIWQLDLPGGVLTAGRAVNISLLTVENATDYEASADVGIAVVAEELNSRAAAAGLGITVSVEGASLVFTSDIVGSAGAFSATLDGVEGTQLAAGADIEGTVDGQEATGVGSVLSLPSGTGGAVGLSLDVTVTGEDFAASVDGLLGAVTYAPGLAQRLATLVSDATAATTGAVGTAQAGANAEIKRYQAAIDAWDDRLEAYRLSLTRQFTAMETALAKLKSSTSALSGLIQSTSSSDSSS